MGACCSGNDSITKQIDRDMKEADEKEQRKRKLMLLGPGSSGKSTIFKQLNWMYASDSKMPETVEPLSQKKSIRENLITGLWTLLTKSVTLYKDDPVKFKDCFVDIQELESTHPGFPEVFKEIQELHESFSEKSEATINEMDLGPKIKPIWMLPFIQETYKYRSLFHIYDNIEYFFDNAEEIFSPDYIPTREHVLKARIRTTGLVSTTLEVVDKLQQTNIFEIWDAGGQRNERAKWIHQFSNVTAILYVAALNHYNQVLFEDEKRNAMHESIELFEKTMSNKCFVDTQVILFLNKRDLFDVSLRKGVNMDCCFTESVNPAWTDPAHQWDITNNYVPPSEDEKGSEEEEEKRYQMCYEKAVAFVVDVFESRKVLQSKDLYHHVTCATDKNNVERVFWDVQNIVIRDNLDKFGLLIDEEAAMALQSGPKRESQRPTAQESNASFNRRGIEKIRLIENEQILETENPRSTEIR